MTAGRVAIGIDSGGTLTRTMCADLDGRVLAYAEGRGGNPNHNSDPKRNVQETVRIVLDRAGRTVSDVAVIVLGIAGLDSADDQKWAGELLALEGISAPAIAFNDAVTAHASVFGAGPGIVAISGTGSNIYGRNEAGAEFTNWDFYHYAGAARHLAARALHRILVEVPAAADHAVVARVLDLWRCVDLTALQQKMYELDRADRNDYKRLLGRTAELMTEYAGSSPIASKACDWLAEELALGAALVAGQFTEPRVGVGLIGSVATCAPIRDRTATRLAALANKEFDVREPQMPLAAGAICLGLDRIGAPATPEVIANLRRTS